MNRPKHQSQEYRSKQPPAEVKPPSYLKNLNEKNAELLRQLQETKQVVEKEIHRRLVLQLSIRAVNKTMSDEDQALLEQLYLDLRSINPELAFATLKAAASLNNANNASKKQPEVTRDEVSHQQKKEHQKYLQQQQQQQQLRQQKLQQKQQQQYQQQQQQQLQQQQLQQQQHQQYQHQQLQQQQQNQYQQYQQHEQMPHHHMQQQQHEEMPQQRRKKHSHEHKKHHHAASNVTSKSIVAPSRSRVEQQGTNSFHSQGFY